MLRIAAIMQLFPIFWGENELRRIKKKTKEGCISISAISSGVQEKAFNFFVFVLFVVHMGQFS